MNLAGISIAAGLVLIFVLALPYSLWLIPFGLWLAFWR